MARRHRRRRAALDHGADQAPPLSANGPRARASAQPFKTCPNAAGLDAFGFVFVCAERAALVVVVAGGAEGLQHDGRVRVENRRKVPVVEERRRRGAEQGAANNICGVMIVLADARGRDPQCEERRREGRHQDDAADVGAAAASADTFRRAAAARGGEAQRRVKEGHHGERGVAGRKRLERVVVGTVASAGLGVEGADVVKVRPPVADVELEALRRRAAHRDGGGEAEEPCRDGRAPLLNSVGTAQAELDDRRNDDDHRPERRRRHDLLLWLPAREEARAEVGRAAVGHRRRVLGV
mmetsp:Transcript_10135/g.33495  ORF Transcript_10135/g.33495 Transcript_10135/m.33495 type:complete len:296 (+) Transcript_10135:928-1815(+)